MSKNSDNTVRVKISELKKKMTKKAKSSKSEGKNKKSNFKTNHPKAAKRIKIAIISIILILIIGIGILVGAFVGLYGDELKIDPKSLVVGSENSIVYDADGNQIAILSGGSKRKSVSIEEMSEYLPKAYVAIEDERFYKHSGIDIPRTMYATFTYILHAGKSSFGGSTITQQVVKNITQDKEKTALAGAMRKVKEISKAFQVEKNLSKDEILELYLNLIFVGGDDINGVELGSVYYFNKSSKDLSIAECAYMAGINHSPNAYKPFATYEDSENPEEKINEMKEKINKRTKTVLGKMKEVEYITKEQYDEAIAEVDEGLKFEKGESSSVTVDVSYVTEAAISQLVEEIMQNEELSKEAAEMLVYSGGYRIYTTQKTDIQKILEEEIVKPSYYTEGTYTTKDEEGKDVKKKENSIPSMVIMDQHTGEVVAAATAVGAKDERIATTKLGYLNFPTEINKQTGSCMKPISVIAPGLETGTITGATVYNDVWTNFGGNYHPKDYDYFRGLINMRTAIAVSANVPHVKALSNIGIEPSVEFCKSVGLPDFSESGLSLALGGIQNGVSPYEMCRAYAAIANGGNYVTPTFYKKVTDKVGNVLYEPKQEIKRVMSEQNAYIETNILTQPVTTGTATYCKMPGIETCAKTGTTNDDYDRWLCGYTPYYTAAAWYGYEYNAVVHYSGSPSNPAGKLWSTVMKEVHKDLENAKFEEPEGLVRRTVCKITGRIAGPTCGENIYTELFTEDNKPTAVCDGHNIARICNDTGMLATDFCPNVTPDPIVSAVPEKEINPTWRPMKAEEAVATFPTEFCTMHTAPAVPAAPEQPANPPASEPPKSSNTTPPANTAGGSTKNTTPPTNTSGGSTKNTTPPTNTSGGGAKNTTPPTNTSGGGSNPPVNETPTNTSGGGSNPPANETPSTNTSGSGGGESNPPANEAPSTNTSGSGGGTTPDPNGSNGGNNV